MSLSDDIVALKRQEEALVFPAFDETTAFEVGCALRRVAMDRALPIVIDIRTADRTLFFSALPGSAPDNGDWARRKSNATLRCHRASLAIGLSLKASGETLSPEIGMDLKDYAAHGGSFPVRVRGVGVIGAITVSGLPQRQDHELITAALAAHFGLDGAAISLPPEDPV